MANSGKLPERSSLSENNLSDMDDPDFLTLCRRVRNQRDSTPHDEVSPELAAEYDAVNREFMRRAGLAWQHAS